MDWRRYRPIRTLCSCTLSTSAYTWMVRAQLRSQAQSGVSVRFSWHSARASGNISRRVHGWNIYKHPRVIECAVRVARPAVASVPALCRQLICPTARPRHPGAPALRSAAQMHWSQTRPRTVRHRYAPRRARISSHVCEAAPPVGVAACRAAGRSPDGSHGW